jgi:hypothetical protein
MNQSERWPALPLAEWKDTYATLHMWTQIVGKVRLALCAPTNHWWSTALYVTARGLTTSPIPYKKGIFEVHFDFINHALEIQTSLGETRTFHLVPRTVAAFYEEFMAALHSLGVNVRVWDMPVEVPCPVRFTLDKNHASYDPEYAHRFWQILATITPVLEKVRAGLSANQAPSISSGAASISPSRVSPAAARPFARMRTPSQKKATRTK